MYHVHPFSEQTLQSGGLARRAAARIACGAAWMLAAALVTSIGITSHAGEGRDMVSLPVPETLEILSPVPLVTPAETLPELIPFLVTTPNTALSERGNNSVQAVRSTKPASVTRVPRPSAADDGIDTGIRPIGSISVNIALPPAREDEKLQLSLPPDAADTYFPEPSPTPSVDSIYSPWTADNCYCPPLNFCYRPLFFEEVNLERYGHCWGIFQPAVSTAKFYGNVALLPYRLIAQRPCQCTYHAHLFRPGGPAPGEVQLPQPPLSRLHMLKRNVLLK